MMNKMLIKPIVVTVLTCLLLGCGVICAENRDVYAKGTGDAALDEAVSLGIISSKQAKKANKKAKESDIPAMLQAAYKHGYGKKSTFLSKMPKLAKKNRKASRYWIAMGIYYSYCEHFYGIKAKNINTFIKQMDKKDPGKKVGFGSFDTSVIGEIYGSKYLDSGYQKGTVIGGGVWDFAKDADAIVEGGKKRLLHHEYGNWWAANVTLLMRDRVTGESVLGLDDNSKWKPAKTLTIGEAAKAALRWWHSFEGSAKKKAYADVGKYDTSIITDELLKKETKLPANSCANLPSSWRGIFFKKLSWSTKDALDGAPDRLYRESEFKDVKAAGFNFVRLNLSFSYLQSPEVKKGYINETRLKELDSILRYCMKYDLHLSICCSQIQDVSEYSDFQEATKENHLGPRTQEEIADYAAIWGALAKRYADIPNEYLSFELYNEISCSEEEYVEKCKPAVDRIRAASPERTIIANIHATALTGESMAKLGCALSYHMYDPRKFSDISAWSQEEREDTDYVHSVTWPFTYLGFTYDAKKILDMPLLWSPDIPYDGTVPDGLVTLNTVRNVAKKHGVGFMVNEFGVFTDAISGYMKSRYTDETYFGYLSDVITTFEKEKIPWSVDMTGEYGMFQPYPLIDGVTYEKSGVWYVDTGLKDFFTRINQVTP